MSWGRFGGLMLVAGLVLGCGASQPTDGQGAERAETEESDTGGSDGDALTSNGASDGANDAVGDADGSEVGTESDDPTGDDGDRAENEAGDQDNQAGFGGIVTSAGDGSPLADAVIIAGDQTARTDADGRFALTGPRPTEPLMIRRPTFLPVIIAAPAPGEDLAIEMAPVLSRGVRVSREVAADGERYLALLDQIETTTVNSLVFDTKDETGEVLYETDVETAERLGAVNPLYQPEELLALANERGLYPITRVVTFEDRIWANGDEEAKLAGAWVDATNRDNWDYPIALANEACRLGFAEIQFDYVRYPAGQTARAAADAVPATSAERSAVIASFLAEARRQLEPQGCGASAAIFGIVMSSETDEGIGQTVEAVSASVDAVSPMLYPSHYGPGWLGFADPNDHPGPVIADALDDGIPRLSEPVQMRPWIQAFYYDGAQIGAQMAEAESRGAGWLLWNASGNYRDDWLPVAER